MEAVYLLLLRKNALRAGLKAWMTAQSDPIGLLVNTPCLLLLSDASPTAVTMLLQLFGISADR
jgi:hypothetical protein